MPPTLSSALRQVRQAPRLVEVLGDGVRAAAAVGGPGTIGLLREAIAGPDELTAVAAVHALGAVDDDAAGAVLSQLLRHPRGFLREHASWALMTQSPRTDAMDPLVAAVAAGGFAGMLAQRTLARWDATGGLREVAVLAALLVALAGERDTPARTRLVETLGLLGGEHAGRAVAEIALDLTEPLPVRIAATAALSDRPGDLAAARTVGELLAAGGELGAVARLAAFDLGLVSAGAGCVPEDGLTVAQLFLHADLDRELSRAGAGDNGGIATLLVRLGDALAAEPGIARALTLSRGTATAAFDALRPGPGHQLAAVPLLSPAVGAAAAWPTWVAARRGIRRLLRAHRVDLLHLRMADVGSLAAAEAATELGIPVVFTLAPDPHGAIDALDRSGALDRAGFGAMDEREHFWFRSRLVRRLTADAAHVVLFPRPRVRDDLRRLVGIDVGAEPDRYTVVPEGIDLTVIEAAETAAEPAELAALVAALPPHRQGLPLVLSVGRLHRVKGMATLVRAWADHPHLWQRSNLVLVGGDLSDPSPDEREQLDQIAAIVAGSPAADGLLLPGHRPNDEVARWLALARAGGSPAIGPGGVYVCASLKEEFGLALLEALAAGLVVVGPDAGGPPTYIENGHTGLLVDTSNPAALAAAVTAGLDLAAAPHQAARVDRARERIRSGFTVSAMAAALRTIYTAVTKEVDP
ncbi:glycosyltransferase [Actinoplanes sp. CA-051413]|uniref:glycosyltransferase n=1 Tax=Actinoplanes sp. CA-051413 TaxID=3239899 RepID=UPI003D993A89